jgi:hypothetical protein
MDPMIEHLQTLLLRDLKAFIQEVEAFPDDVTLWQLRHGISNSAGNLALHVAGNLQFFVGGLLGGTGYVRDRDREFGARSGTRQEVVQDLERAIQVVETVFPTLTPEICLRAFPVTLPGAGPFPTNVFLLRLGVHLAYHLGQANYLRRMAI